MTGADWVIVCVIVVSVIQAAIAGFFHEAFGIAGLVFGYLLAAWNYERLAARYAPYLEVDVVRRNRGFSDYFFGGAGSRRNRGANHPPHRERSWT